MLNACLKTHLTHGAVCRSFAHCRGRVWIFGGTAGSEFYNDLWLLDSLLALGSVFGWRWVLFWHLAQAPIFCPVLLCICSYLLSHTPPAKTESFVFLGQLLGVNYRGSHNLRAPIYILGHTMDPYQLNKAQPHALREPARNQGCPLGRNSDQFLAEPTPSRNLDVAQPRAT